MELNSRNDADVSVSSPAATGGAGTGFECHVGAYWLSQLLVSGIPPILIDTTVSEMSFQTERLGWSTDDFLIVCDRTGADAQRLAGQVKRSFTVSIADQNCVKTVTDFWKDFTGPQFKPGDRLVLVTQRGTNTLLEHFSGLLDCARAAWQRTARCRHDGKPSPVCHPCSRVLQVRRWR